MRVLEHYGVEDLDRTPELEAAVFRIFLAQQRSTPEVALVSALLGSLEPRDPADRTARHAGPRACWSVSVASRSRATRQSATWPAASGSAGSTSRPWTRSGRTSCSACATSSRRSPPTATSPTGRDRIEALAAIPEQIVRFLAERLEQGDPDPGADARGARPAPLPRVRPARPQVSDAARAGVRPAVVASYTLDDRPTRLVSSVGTVAELADAVGRARLLGDRSRRGARGRTRKRSSTSTCTGRTLPTRPTRRATSCGPCVAALPAGPRRTTRLRGRLLRRRPPGRLLRLPARATTGPWSRTTSPVACTRWSGGAWTCGGCATSTSRASRRPRTCCSTSASRGRTLRTGAWWRSPRCARCPSYATRTARSRPCPTPSVPWRTAWSRSGASGWRAAPTAPSST